MLHPERDLKGTIQRTMARALLRNKNLPRRVGIRQFLRLTLDMLRRMLSM